MKIGVVVDNEYYKDVRVRREVRLLKKCGYKVYILCLSFSKKYSYEEEGVVIEPIYIPRKLKDLFYLMMNTLPIYEWWWKKKVACFIRTHKPQIIHTHDLYMSRGVKMGINASKKDIPLILDLHENYPHAILAYKWTQGTVRSFLSRPEKWLRKEAEYLKFADKIVVLSREFKHELLTKYTFLTEKQILVFPNVVDTEEFDKYPINKIVDQNLPSKPRVLYFGVVAQRRGIFQVLDVCEELIKEQLNFSVIIIGPVDSADREVFMKRIADQALQNHIHYIPWIDISELPSYLYACDIALAPFEKNPQHESGVANKVFQYMYGKLPIIASDCKPQKILIENHQIGKIFDSNQSLYENLRELIENEELRKEMGERSREALLSHFHSDAFQQIFCEMYQELASK